MRIGYACLALGLPRGRRNAAYQEKCLLAFLNMQRYNYHCIYALENQPDMLFGEVISD